MNNSFNLATFIDSLFNQASTNYNEFGPKILGALMILFIGMIIGFLTYKLVTYLFRRFKIMEIIENLTMTNEEKVDHKRKDKISHKQKTFGEKVKVNEIVAKAAAYYIFLVFFRFAIVTLGISDVEIFMNDLLKYLPKLFLGIMIAFFGLRFSDFIYNIVFHTLNLTKHKTSKVLASGAKSIILIFTLMVALNYIIVDSSIIETIFTGFIAMLALAGGLAFGLGGKDLAKDILDGFKK